jgi:arylsulfatase A-like enzyme
LEAILPTLAERAEQFIRESAARPEPYLLYFPLTSPHTPLSVAAEWRGKSGLNTYADFVMQTDAVVGRVLTAIDESGEADDTLVLFTSDNGCAKYIGVPELQKLGHQPSGPLRGFKADVWEGGHRVPLVVRWPAVVQAGTTCKQLVQQADVMATLAEIFGVTLPDNAGEDSFSFLSLLRGGDRPVRQNAVNCSAFGVPAIRDGAWKLILASGSGGRTNDDGDPRQPLQLYNLTADVRESTNLAGEQPERVARMQAQLEKLIVEGRSTPGAPQPNDVEVRRFPQPHGAKNK